MNLFIGMQENIIKNTLCILFFISIINPNFSQTEDIKQTFTGFMKLTSGQTIDIKIRIDSLANNNFQGTSITDYNGSNYTKSNIEGFVDLNHKKMNFKELRNTETLSKAKDSTFCYLSCPSLIIDTIANKYWISGIFTGNFLSGKICATGKIFLLSDDTIKTIVESQESINPIPTETTQAKHDTSFQMNETLEINHWNNFTYLEIWDGNIEDDDAITIYLNNKIFIKKLIIGNQKKEIQLPDNQDLFEIKIKAKNEGKIGTNTLKFKLHDYEFSSKLNKGESFRLIFKRE
jgi:hypothetical protein